MIDDVDKARLSLRDHANQYLSHEDRIVRELAGFVSSTLAVTAYDESVVGNAREKFGRLQAILWAIVDESTRAGKPVRVPRAALEAYERSSKLLIEGDDVVSLQLLLWTDSPRGA